MTPGDAAGGHGVTATAAALDARRRGSSRASGRTCRLMTSCVTPSAARPRPARSSRWLVLSAALCPAPTTTKRRVHAGCARARTGAGARHWPLVPWLPAGVQRGPRVWHSTSPEADGAPRRCAAAGARLGAPRRAAHLAESRASGGGREERPGDGVAVRVQRPQRAFATPPGNPPPTREHREGLAASHQRDVADALGTARRGRDRVGDAGDGAGHGGGVAQGDREPRPGQPRRWPRSRPRVGHSGSRQES